MVGEADVVVTNLQAARAQNNDRRTLHRICTPIVRGVETRTFRFLQMCVARHLITRSFPRLRDTRRHRASSPSAQPGAQTTPLLPFVLLARVGNASYHALVERFPKIVLHKSRRLLRRLSPMVRPSD